MLQHKFDHTFFFTVPPSFQNAHLSDEVWEVRKGGVQKLLTCLRMCVPFVLSESDVGPSVEAALSTSPSQAAAQIEPRKTIIGAKKPAAAKKGVGTQHKI